MKIFFYTLGCKVNQYETEAIRELFVKSGHEAAENDSTADIVVINSCTVTAESDRKTRQLLRRVRRANGNAVIVLTGCMVQAFPESSSELCEADIIVGNTNPKKVVSLALSYQRNGERIVEVTRHQRDEKFNTPSIDSFSERTRAFMKIEDGCERYCTYCIIPKARGVVRSRPIEEITAEAKRLASNGFSELVLVGINLSAFGKGTEFNLCDAVEAVCSVDGIKRVRLGSLEPDHITDQMLLRLKAQEKFCPQFHLSLQSGCDTTLKRMNRQYNSDFYYDLVKRIRALFPDAAITTDIMVGFAGETDEEFKQSLEFVKKVGFAKSHIFMYSRRTGTVAAALPNQVSNAEKSARAHILSATTAESEKEFLKSSCGKVYPVLFENSDGNFFEGYTPNYLRVLVKDDGSISSGNIYNVIITEAKDSYCIAKLI